MLSLTRLLAPRAPVLQPVVNDQRAVRSALLIMVACAIAVAHLLHLLANGYGVFLAVTTAG